MPFPQNEREGMAEELSDRLIMEELLDYGFACTFAKCEFDEVGFDPDNK